MRRHSDRAAPVASTPLSSRVPRAAQLNCNRTLHGGAGRYNWLHLAAHARRAGPLLSIMVAKHAAPKILVVDDDVRLRDLLSRYLTEQGFQVATLAGRARSRQEAPARPAPSHRARSHAAGRGRARRLPPAAGGGRKRADRHADAQRAKTSTASSASRRAPTTTCRSRSIRASSSPASTRCCAGRRSGSLRARRRAEGKVAFGPFTLDLAARTLANGDATIHLTTGEFSLVKVFVQHAAAAAGARETDAAGARTRPRRVRPGDRRPGVAAAQADRARSGQPPLHPDGLGIRLRLRAG